MNGVLSYKKRRRKRWSRRELSSIRRRLKRSKASPLSLPLKRQGNREPSRNIWQTNKPGSERKRSKLRRKD